MFQANQQFGNYTLVKRIGRGGFGEVWLAEHRTELLTTQVAVKLPHREQVNLEAIRQEAQLWARASGHANILPIIEANIYDGQIVIVSEYAPDGSLEEMLHQEIPIKQTLEIVTGILNGLEFLHARQIIHRDIKPANILLQGETPRLADFGISRIIKTTAISTAIVGTPRYMAPEAFDGKRTVQTDIWSVGVILYQMITGNIPFRQDNPTELMWAIVTKDPEPVSESVQPDLRRIIQRALAKLPENRFPTAREMREELQRALLNISHPTFAPTEVFNKPHESIRNDALTIEDKSIVTKTPFQIPPTMAAPLAVSPGSASPLSTPVNVIPPTESSIAPPSAPAKSFAIFGAPIESTKKPIGSFTRWLSYFLASLIGLITLFIGNGIARTLNYELGLFNSITQLLIGIPLFFILFGIAGILLGYLSPQERWKWGLWLNLIIAIRMLYLIIVEFYSNDYNPGIFTGIRFRDPDVSNFVEVALFPVLVIFTCFVSYLSSRRAARNPLHNN